MRFALPEGCLAKVQGGDIVGVLSDIAAPLSSPRRRHVMVAM